MKNESVEEAENQAVAADRQRERDHRDGGEARTAHKLPERVSNVLRERFHELSPLWPGKRWFSAAGEAARGRDRRGPPLPCGAGEQIPKKVVPHPQASARARMPWVGHFLVERGEQVGAVLSAEAGG